jgi:nitrogen fixation protein NifQ
VIAVVAREISLDPASVPSRASAAEAGCEDIGAVIYRMLTGCDPVDAAIDDDGSFDRHVFASILAVAAMEGQVCERAGLSADELAALVTQCFPAARSFAASRSQQNDKAEDDEVAMVRDLLLAHRSTVGDTGRWLAAMVARRSMEPNHLWEDLGLRDRGELTRLLNRHFGPIAVRNTRSMRWKRFFYRTLCESDGFVMCSTPVCSNCGDFNLCFGEESGESRLAQRRRAFELEGSAAADTSVVSARSPARSSP